MCGIIGTIQKNNATITYCMENLITCAYNNKHRGNTDGVGLLFKTIINEKEKKENFFLIKTLLRLEEIQNNCVITKGNITNKKERKDVGMEKLKREQKLIRKISQFPINFGLIHHRKASYNSEISLRNIHPFKVRNGIYYMHNGYVYDAFMLKNYLEICKSVNFNTSLDTEVLAILAEEYLEKYNYSELAIKTVKRYLDSICVFPFGVLIRIDTNKNEIIIIKNENRELFIVETETNYLYVSEVPTNIKNIQQIIRLNFGTYKLSSHGLTSYNDTTNMMTIITDMYDLSGTFTTAIKKCDFCDESKNCYSLDCGWENVYICLNCYLLGNEADIKVQNKKEKMTIKPPHKLKSEIAKLSLPKPNYDSPSNKQYINDNRKLDNIIAG